MAKERMVMDDVFLTRLRPPPEHRARPSPMSRAWVRCGYGQEGCASRGPSVTWTRGQRSFPSRTSNRQAAVITLLTRMNLCPKSGRFLDPYVFTGWSFTFLTLKGAFSPVQVMVPENGCRIIMSSDGLWDVLSLTKAVKIAR